jgi:hypothetical protein
MVVSALRSLFFQLNRIGSEYTNLRTVLLIGMARRLQAPILFREFRLPPFFL